MTGEYLTYENYKSGFGRAMNKLLILYVVIVTIYLSAEQIINQRIGSITEELAGMSIFFSIIAIYIGSVLAYIERKGVIKAFLPDFCLLFYIAVCMFASFYNQCPMGGALRAVLYETKYIFLFLAFSKLRISRGDVVFVITAIIALAMFQGLLGFIQFFGGESVRAMFWGDHPYMSDDAGYIRDNALARQMFGTILNKNYFAILMLWGGLLWICFGELLNFKITARYKYAFAGFCIMAVLLSMSKFTSIAMLLAFVCFIKEIRLRACAVLLGVIMLCVFWGAYYDKYEKDFRDYWDVVDAGGRITLLKATAEVVAESPVFGLGGGNWGLALAMNDKTDKPLEFIEVGSYELTKGVMMDNNWCSIVGQFGIAGLAAFSLFLFCVYRMWFGQYQPGIEPFSKAIITTNLTMLLIFTATAMVYVVFTAKVLMFAYWATSGICYSYLKNSTLQVEKNEDTYS